MFGRRKSATAVVEEPERTLEETARMNLQAAEQRLATARGEIATFVSKHTATIDGRSAYLSPTLTGRAALDAERTRLVRACDAAYREFQTALVEWNSAR
jgi:hypothetical protein